MNITPAAIPVVMRKYYEHPMKSTFLFLILVFISTTIVSGQQKLTTEQILKYWIKNEKPFHNDSLIDTRFDKDLDNRINRFVDSLKDKTVDSIIVYSSAYPGYEGNRKCKNGLFPIYTYIIWKISNVTYIQKIEGDCVFEVQKLNSTTIFDFYEVNHGRLHQEFFMPVILNGEKDKKGQSISYSMKSIDHEPNYCVYYWIGTVHRTLKFAESDIQDKQSLFYEYNKKLLTVEWWKLIKKYTTEVKN